MFWDRYPITPIRHIRVLCSFGRERGVGIVPKPMPPIPPPEKVHEHSVIIPLGPEKAMVIEWTGDATDRHVVDL